MNHKEAFGILIANAEVEECSFVGLLSEYRRFDQKAFWDLYNAASIVAGSNSIENLDVRDPFFWVYRCILMSVIHHFDPDDLFKIDNLPSENLSLYLERVEWVFHPAILGHQLQDWMPALELRNPREDELVEYFGSQPPAP